MAIKVRQDYSLVDFWLFFLFKEMVHNTFSVFQEAYSLTSLIQFSLLYLVCASLCYTCRTVLTLTLKLVSIVYSCFKLVHDLGPP